VAGMGSVFGLIGLSDFPSFDPLGGLFRANSVTGIQLVLSF